MPHRLPEPALDPIAPDRIALLLADNEADTAAAGESLRRSAPEVEYRAGVHVRAAARVDLAELPVIAKTLFSR